MITPQQQGSNFEESFAERVGAELVKNSGALWYAKGDLKNVGKVLWQLKSTAHKSFSVKVDDLRTMVRDVLGPAGVGSSYIPLMAIEVDGEQFILSRANDFLTITEEGTKLTRADKVSQRVKAAKVPSLFKE